MGGGCIAERDGGEFLMADYLTTDTELASVADAIRTKGGTSSSLVYPTGFVSAINAIPTGSSITVESLSVTQNGSYTAPSGKAYSPITVNVPGSSGMAYAMFEASGPNEFTFVAGYPLTFSDIMYNCLFCGEALIEEEESTVFISGNSDISSSLVFSWLENQFSVPISMLNYSGGVLTLESSGLNMEAGELYAFLKGTYENIATMSEVETYFGLT